LISNHFTFSFTDNCYRRSLSSRPLLSWK